MGPYVNDVIDKYREFLELILGSTIQQITHQTHYIARLIAMAPNIQLDALVLSKHEIKQINAILKHRDKQMDHRQLVKLTHDVGKKVVEVLADYLAIPIDFSDVLTVSDLSVDGHDLIKMKVPKEKRASLLKAILYEVIDGTLENNLESIVEFINQWNNLF